MIEDWQERTNLLIKKDKLEILKKSNVLIAGLGGVGAFAAEMICRAGVGKMTIIDSDNVKPSNKNRQLLAMESTVGLPKAEIMGARLRDINPEIELCVHNEYLRDQFSDQILDEKFDYVVDAIDTLAPKVFFIRGAMLNGLKLVSSMGAGGRTDPAKIKIADFSDSHNCDLARLLRKRLGGFDIKSGFKVVFSTEISSEESKIHVENVQNKKTTIGTISYLPAIFGCYCASVVIRDLIGEEVPLEISPYRKRKQNN